MPGGLVVRRLVRPRRPVLIRRAANFAENALTQKAERAVEAVIKLNERRDILVGTQAIAVLGQRALCGQ